MIGGPQFLSHMAYIASPKRLAENDPAAVEYDQGASGEMLGELDDESSGQ
ncbi:hypothetical protein AB0K60_32750 [Thermopolyspora sp. NPDC052614]